MKKEQIEEMKFYQRAYIIVMGQMEKLIRDHFDKFNDFTVDKNVSILPENYFIDGVEVTSEDVQKEFKKYLNT